MLLYTPLKTSAFLPIAYNGTEQPECVFVDHPTSILEEIILPTSNELPFAIFLLIPVNPKNFSFISSF